jgi:hypothetical protein
VCVSSIGPWIQSTCRLGTCVLFILMSGGRADSEMCICRCFLFPSKSSCPAQVVSYSCMPNAMLDSYVYTLPAKSSRVSWWTYAKQQSTYICTSEERRTCRCLSALGLLDRVSLDVGWMEIQQQSLLNWPCFCFVVVPSMHACLMSATAHRYRHRIMHVDQRDIPSNPAATTSHAVMRRISIPNPEL